MLHAKFTYVRRKQGLCDYICAVYLLGILLPVELFVRRGTWMAHVSILKLPLGAGWEEYCMAGSIFRSFLPFQGIPIRLDAVSQSQLTCRKPSR